MNNINVLLSNLCPNGVQYKRFDEVCTLNARIGWQRLTKAEYRETGEYMLVTGTDFTAAHTVNYDTCVYVTEDRYDQDKKIQLKDGDVLITKDGTLGKVAQVIGLPMPATLNGGVFVVRPKDNNLDSRFIMHYLLSGHFQKVVDQQKTGSTISHLTQGLFSRLQIPVPPLEVQREIVQILDKFTLLSAELSAELSARKKQYEYYKSSLFDFDESVPTIKIGDFTRVFSASRVHKSDWKSEGVPFWRSSDLISFYNGVENSRGKVYISQELYEKLSAKSGKIEENDILVTGGGTIGIPYIVPSNDPFYVKDADLLCIKKNDVVMTKYLYHYFLSQEFKDYLMGITHDATIAHYTISQIKDTPIPVPSIDKQKKIVEILDKFEDLTKNISVGLPAEIEARNKQYEYYRDKLLTFDKAV